MSHDTGALYTTGFYREALANLENARIRRSLTVPEEISRAELLSLTGAVETAQASATKLKRVRKLTVRERCRLSEVLGLSAFRLGELGRASAEYHAGIELAAKNGEVHEECRLRVHLFRHQIHWMGPHTAAADARDLRRRVHNLAEPSLSLKFHLGLVELGAKLGLLPRARRHLETARALLASVPDKAVHAEFALSEVALTALESNLSSALGLALQLATIADEVGSSSAQFGVSTNLAHLLVTQCRFKEASEWIERGLHDRRFGGGSEVALRDTMLLLHLSNDDLNAAAKEANTIESLLAAGDSRDSFFGVWHLVNRVRWLYRMGEAEAGLKIALETIPRAERIEDRTLIKRLQLLAAEGLERTDRASEGLVLMAKAVRDNPDAAPEMIAEASRVAGRLIAKEEPDVASRYFERAARILRLVGNLAAAAEVDREASSVLGQASLVSSNGARAATLTERFAVMTDLGAHPHLLASEAMALLADSGSVSSATLYEHHDGHQRLISAYSAVGEKGDDGDTSEVVRIELKDDDQKFTIVGMPYPTVAARAGVLSIERLVNTALTIARIRQNEREQAVLWPESTPEQELGLVCASERMVELIKTVRRIAAANLTVLLTGETGVGKELFARALHIASPRKERDFLPFNCTTVSKDLLDSQLFGHRRGAFTGAHEDGPGVIRAAAGGTLFLDEIGEMSAEAQPKLLRFLESGEILPVGEPRPVHVDVRIVAATNADLEQLVKDGRFREDLYYRLNVLPIHIPPLRERREEIPALVEHFLEQFGREQQKPMLRVADDTLEYLLLYRWPGNVRQLANEIRRMVALAEPGSVLLPAHLSRDIVASRRTIPVQASEMVMPLDQTLAAATRQLERAVIERALKTCAGRNDAAAKLLGLSRKGLYLKRQRLGI